jgi:hypothetical protein
MTQTPLDLISGMLREAAGIEAGAGDDGAIHLQFDDGLNLAIGLSPDHADLVLYSVLGPAADRDGVALITAALALNLHQVATRGGAIGLDTEHHTLVFSWRMRVSGTEPVQWMNAIEQFCITTRALHEQLKEAIGDLSEPELAALEERALRDRGFDEGGALESDPTTGQSGSDDGADPVDVPLPTLMIRG